MAWPQMKSSEAISAPPPPHPKKNHTQETGDQ